MYRAKVNIDIPQKNNSMKSYKMDMFDARYAVERASYLVGELWL
jgi:hypothetical protein